MSPGRRSRVLFGVAVVTLAGSAGFLHVAKSQGMLQILKKPLPIRKPLENLDRGCVAPFTVVVSQRLAAETISELGTEEYAMWSLRAPDEDEEAPARMQLSVTYYTGVQDQVPHVPEECMFQGAFTPAGDDTLTVNMQRLGETVGVRRLSFYPPRTITRKTSVYYTICVNGAFCTGRQEARIRMADLRDSHLYYAKVEIAFQDLAGKSVEETDRIACDLMDQVLVELFKSHWPARGSERGA